MRGTLVAAALWTVGAFGFWEHIGLDWNLMLGRYQARKAISTCGGFSSVGYRVPEIEELIAAYEGGIANPDKNPGFAKAILKKRIFFSNTGGFLLKPSSARHLFDFRWGTAFIKPDGKDFLGLLCVVEPGFRRYWYERASQNYWSRGKGKATAGGAKAGCTGFLGEWLPSITELQQAFENGLTEVGRNPEFAQWLHYIPYLLSSTPTAPGKKPKFSWALDLRTGNKIEVPNNPSKKHFYLCGNLIN